VIILLGYFIPHNIESFEAQKDCDSQDIIIEESDSGVTVYISCIPAKGGTVTGNRTVEYVDKENLE